MGRELLTVIGTVLRSELVPTAESVTMEYLGPFWKSSKIQALTLYLSLPLLTRKKT